MNAIASAAPSSDDGLVFAPNSVGLVLIAPGVKKVMLSAATPSQLIEAIMVTHGVVNLAGTDNEVARWIWHNLVPKSGQAAFLQGELLRAVEKLRWEAQGNGNINWDDGFEMLIDLLADHLLSEARFSREERAAITSDLERLRDFLPVQELKGDAEAMGLPYVENDLYDRLTSSVVRFCRLNPRLVAYQHNPVQHR